MAEKWLVIDDSSTIQRVIKLAFLGYDVQIAEAESCLEAAREILHLQPSLVIADAALGGVQGVQDFLALKAQAPQAPFIILEGSYDNIDELQFRNVGFRHFLKKPFDAAQLLNVTRQALGRALPYRSEAAGGQQTMPQAQAVAQAQAVPQSAVRPVNEDTMRVSQNFAPLASSSGFDLGLLEPRVQNQSATANHAQTRPSLALDPNVSAPNGGGYPALNLQASNAFIHANVQQQSKVEIPLESSRRAVSFSLDDMNDAQSRTFSAAPAQERSWDGEMRREPESSAWKASQRSNQAQLGNLLEPMLQEEMEKYVRLAVEDYCRKHFSGIARELIQKELDRLTQDRSRLLME